MYCNVMCCYVLHCFKIKCCSIIVLCCVMLCFYICTYVCTYGCIILSIYLSIYLSILGLVISANKSPKSPPHVLPTDIGDRKCTDDGFGLGAWNRKGSYEPSTSWLIVSPSVPRCVKWTHTFFLKTPTSFLGLEHVELSHIVTNPPPQHLLQPSVSSCQVID